MKRMNFLLMMMAVWAVVGCAGIDGGRGGYEEKVVSLVLRQAFARTLAEFSSRVGEQNSEPLPEAARPEAIVRQIDLLHDRFPSVFEVTELEERRFESGQFDSRANRLKVRESIQVLRDRYRMRDLPLTTLLLIRKAEEGELQGAQLELAARLLSAQADYVEDR